MTRATGVAAGGPSNGAPARLQRSATGQAIDSWPLPNKNRRQVTITGSTAQPIAGS